MTNGGENGNGDKRLYMGQWMEQINSRLERVETRVDRSSEKEDVARVDAMVLSLSLKVDKLVTGLAKQEAAERARREAAKDAGHRAGRNTAVVISGLFGIVIVILEIIFRSGGGG